MDDLEASLNALDDQIGWEILLGDRSLFKVGESYAGKTLATYLTQDDIEIMDSILGAETVSASNNIVSFNNYTITCQKGRVTTGETPYDTYTLYFSSPKIEETKTLFALMFELDSNYDRTGVAIEDESATSQITLPSDLPDCTAVNENAGDLFEKMTIE